MAIRQGAIVRIDLGDASADVSNHSAQRNLSQAFLGQLPQIERGKDLSIVFAGCEGGVRTFICKHGCLLTNVAAALSHIATLSRRLGLQLSNDRLAGVNGDAYLADC